MTIAETEREIVDEFSMFDNWEDKYQYVIDMGKDLKPLAEDLKTDDRLIKGCQSRVWLHSSIENGNVIYAADSDAIITKGLVALMIRTLSGHKPAEIMEAKVDFIDEIGLKAHLSPTRANGLLSMIKQMKLDAMALQTKIS
ncbi:MAG TPA: SufE family protein [Bacteroidia bacterium]